MQTDNSQNLLVVGIGVLIVVIVALAALVQLINRRNVQKSLQDVGTDEDTPAIPAAEPLPCRLTPLLTTAERRFFEALHEAVASCPQCGSLMVLRMATKGKHAGEQFWGCTNFPVCRAFTEATGAAMLVGYTEDVDWAESTAMDLLFLALAQSYVDMNAFWDELEERYSGLIETTGFTAYLP